MAQRFQILRPVPSQFTIQQHFSSVAPENPDTAGYPGVTFDTPAGTPVRAASQGLVEFAGQMSERNMAPRLDYSWHIIIQHPEGYSTLYAHLLSGKILVNRGQEVVQGQEIALSGEGPLHFELRTGAEDVSAIDPEPFFLPEPAETNPAYPNQPARSNPPGGRPKRKKASPAGPEVPERMVELRKGQCSLRVALTNRPWALGIDALVVPAGVPFGELSGGFAHSWLKEIGAGASRSVREIITQNITPSSIPVASIALDGKVGQKALSDLVLPHHTGEESWVLLATARSQDGQLNLSNLTEMTAQVVHEALRLGATRLAIPLVGTGENKLDPVDAMGYILDTLAGDLDLGDLQEITIATLLPEVVEAARYQINRYRNNLSQTLTQDEAVSHDTLGIAPQVHALAEALMLQSMGASLAVGILGSWGSGKTSVMKMIEAHIQERLHNETRSGWDEQNPSPYIGHFYPIWFNAWNYAKSNLWASLMDTIFVSLDFQLTNDETRGKGGDMWTVLRGRKKEAINDIQKKEAELAGLRAESLGVEMEYKKQAQQVLSVEGKTLAGNMLKNEIGRLVSKTASPQIRKILDQEKVSPEEVTELLEQMRGLGMAWARLKKLIQENRSLFLVWLAVGLLTPIILFLSAYIYRVLNPLLAWITGWVPLVLPVVRVLVTWFSKVEEMLKQYFENAENERGRLQGLADTWMAQKMAENEKQVSDVLKDKQLSPERVEKELNKLANPGSPDQKNLSAYHALIKMKEANLEQELRKTGMTGHFTSLAEFVQSRLDSGLYQKHLGLMNQVVTDIRDLTDGLVVDPAMDSPEEIQAKKALFPRGQARVILFIDDLDRCPPRRVVEVLEAVQLLLKTPLFVVVLGLDTRYATRALEKEYKDILVHSGDPSGLDYIEKIVQIPYRVRPIEANGLDGFLRSQMELLEQVAPARFERKAPKARQEAPGKEAGSALDNSSPTAAATTNEPASQPVAAADSPSVSSNKPAQEPDLPPEIVRFRPEDLLDIKACCSLVNLTPRSIKRLVNVLKLLEVYWFRTLGRQPNRQTKQSIIALLVLAAAYPEVLVEVFAQMELRFADQQANQQKIGDYMYNLEPDSIWWAGRSLYVMKWQFERFRIDVLALRKATPGSSEPVDFLSPSFANFGVSTFNLTRSFSFVGDPSYTLEDETKAEKS